MLSVFSAIAATRCQGFLDHNLEQYQQGGDKVGEAFVGG